MDEFIAVFRNTGNMMQICIDGKQYDSRQRAICYLTTHAGFTKKEAVEYILALPVKYI